MIYVTGLVFVIVAMKFASVSNMPSLGFRISLAWLLILISEFFLTFAIVGASGDFSDQNPKMVTVASVDREDFSYIYSPDNGNLSGKGEEEQIPTPTILQFYGRPHSDERRKHGRNIFD